MIKVSLLGDSICLSGYGTVLPALLGGDYEVFIPDDNCRFSKYTLRRLFDCKRLMAGSRIVHWNNGLWDMCNLFGDGPFSSEEEYVTNMLKIADILLQRYEKVIFATTTPVRPENVYDKNDVIERYNALIVPLLREKGVMINDLHSLVAQDIYRYISKDNIHLSEEGIKLCAEQVARTIQTTAASLADSTPKTEADTTEAMPGAPVIL